MNGEGNLTSKYVRGNKLISKDGNEYFGYDGHGSVVNISNESGKSIKSYDYDAFGVEFKTRMQMIQIFSDTVLNSMTMKPIAFTSEQDIIVLV